MNITNISSEELFSEYKGVFNNELSEIYHCIQLKVHLAIKFKVGCRV